MSLDAGRRNKKIVIQRTGEPVDDGYTTTPGDWATWWSGHADVIYGSGTEQRQASQEGASQAASFEVLSNSKTKVVSVTDRILFDGGTWDISANIDIDNGAGRRITATRAAA